MRPWPTTFARDQDGIVSLGGIPMTELATTFGTPLYIYDQETLATTASRFTAALAATYPRGRAVYAAKAFSSTAIIRLLRDLGLGLDVSSGGELFAGLRAGMPPGRITFHGNAKTAAELGEALDAGIGLLVVDNLPELEMLVRLTASRGVAQRILLRLNPGIDVHTHEKIKTGVLRSKFGLPIETGDAARAVEVAVRAPGVTLAGYHAHLGSQLFDMAALQAGVEALVAFAAGMRDRHALDRPLDVLSPGGGFGIPYLATDPDLDVEGWVGAIAAAVRSACARHAIALPELVIEPGRAIAGPAGVALYRVGPTKVIPGVARYVAVDGGMADNIRPTLYGARYEVTVANRLAGGPDVEQTVVGKFCEAGDILVERAMVPAIETGDLLAFAAAGAYSLAMASNYNLATRPAVVLVGDGRARLIRRRETYDDMVRLDIDEGGTSDGPVMS
ncbi:MAG: diaminopimelate decarboxylase [Chloroflexota bacterium]|nr:diaminopimelate decarboxylase [Chloroflexota bacterium]